MTTGRMAWLVVLLGMAGGTCGGCASTGAYGFRVTGNGLQEEGLKSWEEKSPPEVREKIHALAEDQTSLFHFIRASLAGLPTRGTASTHASSSLAKRLCPLHPPSKGIRPERNWDVIYDQKVQEAEEKRLRLPSPLDALVHHEVMGHIVPYMADPGRFDGSQGDESSQENEREAIQQENEYRRHVGLPLVPPNLIFPSEH